MATIQSLTESFGVLKRNPVVFGVGLLYAVILLPQTALSLMNIPLVPQALQAVTFFITPFVLAGLLGMVYEGRVRSTGIGTFVDIGKSKYLSLLGANLIQVALAIIFGIISFFVLLLVVFVLGIGVATASPESGLAAFGITFAVAVVGLVLVFLLVQFFLQFFAPAIVVDNVGVMGGYRRSVGLVKRNIVQTLGFSLVNLLLALLLISPGILLVVAAFLGLGPFAGAGPAGPGAAGAGTAGASGISSTTGPGAETGFGVAVKGGIVAYSFLTTVIMTPFRTAFAVSFYDNHRPSHWD
ncbi:DUF7544 domain-containing protein [Haloarcula salinisoli]|uniref:DUF7847 domain-containing protein n=1 Tax=Haloarcula salinisoli TaxID=2487746 RepID=A0A8J7YI54_9EURY|nr:hypothetical protein [Halomicroarcula salinisoli]MBX0285383.1 hypothetical protein [Halomicroarcula salinisoli]MBX0303139.1 hypothetical protein [Halomicroarcula salinisoli]